jgi:hypothetical protein
LRVGQLIQNNLQMFTDIDLTSILYLDTVTYLSKKNETGIYETDIVTHVAKERRRLL